MALQVVEIIPGGGLSTEAGPLVHVAPDAEGHIVLPYLIECQNAIFDTDGWPRKAPGASKVNSSATGASDAVLGIFDYWKSGTSGSPAQQRLVYSGTALYRESSGTMTSITTGLESGKMPWFAVINDDCVFSTTSTVDVPGVWDQSTYAALGGSPPNFSVCFEHRGRAWAFGAPGAQSRLYYSVQDNHEDWTGSGSGSIDIAPNDGSVIKGAKSHKGEIIVWKGGGGLSMHRITGSSPTGADAFALVPFIAGVGASNQQSIVAWGDDLVWLDDLAFHSLKATAAFGDYNVANISSPISTFFLESLNQSRFPFVWGANIVTRGYVLWTITQAQAGSHDLVLGWDYRWDPPRWFVWPMAAVGSIGIVRDSNGRPTPWYGTYTGFVLRGDQSAKNWAGAAIGYRVTFPYVSMGDPFYDKVLGYARVGYSPTGESDFTLAWQRDGLTQESVTLDQTGSGDTLGPSSSEFTMDTSTLGGGTHEHAFTDQLEGRFKAVQFQMSEATLDTDFRPHSLAVAVEFVPNISPVAVEG